MWLLSHIASCAILQRFGDRRRSDDLAVRQIGDEPRLLQDTVASLDDIERPEWPRHQVTAIVCEMAQRAQG